MHVCGVRIARALPNVMKADICDGGDEVAVAKFRETLRRLGAKNSEGDWAIGVATYRVQIGSEVLTIFSDTWSLDVEGADPLVQKVLTEYRSADGAV
jgi:hypothetical protein